MKDYLSEWTDAENRIIPNLVEMRLGEAIAARQTQQDESPTSSSTNSRRKKGGEG